MIMQASLFAALDPEQQARDAREAAAGKAFELTFSAMERREGCKPSGAVVRGCFVADSGAVTVTVALPGEQMRIVSGATAGEAAVELFQIVHGGISR